MVNSYDCESKVNVFDEVVPVDKDSSDHFIYFVYK